MKVYRKRRIISLLLAAALLLPALGAAAPVALAAGPTVTGSASYAGYGPELAFDGDLSTRFAAQGKGESAWLQAAFEAPITFQAVEVAEYANAAEGIEKRIQTVTVSVSENGEQWESVKSGALAGGLLVLDAPVTTQYCKLEFTSSGEVNILEISFTDAAEQGEKVDFSEAKLTCSGEYNYEPYIYPATQAVDGDPSTYWAAEGVPAWLCWEFDTQVSIDRVVVQEATPYGERMTEVALELSNDGTSWSEIARQTGLKGDGENAYTLELEGGAAASWFRLRFESEGEVNISEVEFYAAEGDVLSAPQASAPSGNYDAPLEITLTHADPEASIYYTTDGTAPTAESTHYTTPIAVAQDVEIRAIAVKGDISSIAASFRYHINSVREQLGALIDEAEQVDVRLYKIQSVTGFQSALRSARTNYKNESMADSQLQNTIELLQEAMDAISDARLGENLALGATAEADSVYEDMEQYNGQKTVDGDFNTRWASEANRDADRTFYLTIDLGEAKTFNQVLVFETPAYPGRIQALSAYVSDDGETWRDWRIGSTAAGTTISLVADEVTARYVRIAVDGFASAGMNLDEVGLYLDPGAVETEPATEVRPIDPSWNKPEPDEEANVFQKRKAAMRYGLFLHYGVNTFNHVEWGNGREELSDYTAHVESVCLLTRMK